jgi:LysW-gamma-L-lysine carboxypeptidase
MFQESASSSITEGESKRGLSLGKRSDQRVYLAEKILTTYSPSGQETEIANLILSELKTLELSPRMDSAGNVICEVGSGPKSLLFCPHLDTVKGELPFRRVGNILFGRGASDAKGALLSMLFAFEDIVEEMKKENFESRIHVIFAGVVGEEMESKGLRQLITDQIRADGAIFGEPGGVSRITVGYRGHVPISFEIETKEAHASAPWLTTNAAEVAFFLYEALKKNLASESSQRVDSISVALTKIQSGASHNVIPGSARMSVDVRTPVGVSSETVKQKVKEIALEIEESRQCRIIVVFGETTEPYRSKLDSNLVRAMTRSMLRLGLKPSFVSKSGTGDMNEYSLAFGTDSITYGPGNPRESHTDHESINLDDVFASTNVLVKTFEEFFGLSSSP